MARSWTDWVTGQEGGRHGATRDQRRRASVQRRRARQKKTVTVRSYCRRSPAARVWSAIKDDIPF